MSEKAGEDSGAGKGFAGLVSLLSEVDGDIAEAEKEGRGSGGA